MVALQVCAIDHGGLNVGCGVCDEARVRVPDAAARPSQALVRDDVGGPMPEAIEARGEKSEWKGGENAGLVLCRPAGKMFYSFLSS